MRLQNILRAATAVLMVSLTADAQETGARNENFCNVIGRLDPHAQAKPPIEAPLSIRVSFSNNMTTAQRAVCLQAVSEWSTRFEFAGALVNPYPVSFMNGPLGGQRLAQANTTWDSAGTLQGSIITIDNDGTSNFFVDPTPGDDSEFDSAGACIDNSCTQSDLLTVMRHELGHALGWTGFFTSGPAPPNNNPGPLMSGNTFDPSRLNVPIDPAQTSHANAAIFAGDLMGPGLGPGTRVGISNYPDLSVVARAYGHGVTLRFIDSDAGGIQLGTAFSPYLSFSFANALAPEGVTLIVSPGTYDEINPAVLDRAHKIVLARGGSVLLD